MLLAQAPTEVPVEPTTPAAVASVQVHAAIARQVRVGDVVFIRVPWKPFREVAATTRSWTNHVGVVVATDGAEPAVAESTLPFSRLTPLSRFVDRSEAGRVAVLRWRQPLTPTQLQRIPLAAQQRIGVRYDTGFDVNGSGQFCSKFVREVMAEATGHALGEVVAFRQLLAMNPDVNLRFWKVWYFGRIPWDRQTVSPASILHSPLLYAVFDGQVLHDNLRSAPAPATR